MIRLSNLYTRLCKTFQGETLIEVLVATTILVTVVTIFFLQTGKLDLSLNPALEYNAYLKTNELIIQQHILNPVDEDSMENKFKVEKTIKCSDNPNLFLVIIKLTLPNGKVILERKRYINTRIEI